VVSTQIGDISEYTVALEAMRRGFGVLKPLGNSFPYDFVFDINSRLIKIQVKTAVREKDRTSYFIPLKDKTGKKPRYTLGDFDFLIAVIQNVAFYVFPITFVLSYKSHLTFGTNAPNSKTRTLQYKDAWNLLCGDEARAACDSHKVNIVQFDSERRNQSTQTA
jgi:hypothetical protein